MSARKDWGTARWGDVLEIRNGRNQREVEHPEGAYPIYGSGGVMGRANDYICDARTTIIGRKGSISSPLFVEEPFWNVDTAFGLHASEELEPRFLFYFCQSYDFWQHNRGTTIPSLVKSELLEVRMPLPTLPEQQRIVRKLDAAFAALAEAQANVERNRANARELFESYLNGVFEGKEGWQETTLGELGRVCMCKRILKEQTSSTGDIPFYKIGTFGKAPDAFIAKDIYEDFKRKYPYPKKGDVLISASGTIGRGVVFDGEPAYFQDSNIVWIDNDEKQVLNDYLYQFYKVCDWSPTKGATISRLYNDDLRKARIAYPSLGEQRKLVDQMVELDEQTRTLETTYQQKLTELAGLKKGLLGAAFRGEL